MWLSDDGLIFDQTRLSSPHFHMRLMSTGEDGEYLSHDHMVRVKGDVKEVLDHWSENREISISDLIEQLIDDELALMELVAREGGNMPSLIEDARDAIKLMHLEGDARDILLRAEQRAKDRKAKARKRS